MLRKLIERLRGDVADNTNKVAGFERRLQAAERELCEEMGKVRKLWDAAGGLVWKTREGCSLRVRDISDTHLAELIGNDWGGVEARQAFLAEKRRRVDDDTWAKRQGTLSQRDRVEQLEKLIGELIMQLSDHPRKYQRGGPVRTARSAREMRDNGAPTMSSSKRPSTVPAPKSVVNIETFPMERKLARTAIEDYLDADEIDGYTLSSHDRRILQQLLGKVKRAQDLRG